MHIFCSLPTREKKLSYDDHHSENVRLLTGQHSSSEIKLVRLTACVLLLGEQFPLRRLSLPGRV